MIQKTPLYNAHLASGGKLVDFAGWSLPINYGSQINEHHRVRSDAGMFDVSHMTVTDVEGPGALAALQRLLANDVARLEQDGSALYSCMLNEQGGVIDDLIVYRLSPTRYRVISNAATRERVLEWMPQQLANFDCQLAVLPDYAMIAVQGPRARDRLASILAPGLAAELHSLPAFHACWTEEQFIACTGYTGEDGFEIILPAGQAEQIWADLLAAGVAPTGLGARDSLRLEAGMSLYGHELDEKHTPLESGLAWTVSWEPAGRAFIGRPALEKQQKGGCEYSLTGLILEQRGVIREGQKVYNAELESGMICSGAFSPSLGLGIALARVSKMTPDRVEVEVRGKRLKARRVKPPFVRKGQSCIDGQEFICPDSKD